MADDSGPPPARPGLPPVVALDDDVLADLLLVGDGLLDGRSVRPGAAVSAPADDGVRSDRVTVRLADDVRGPALAAGALQAGDAEGFVVLRLDDLVADGDGVAATVRPTGRVSTGPGHSLRLAAVPLPPPAGERVVLVLSRPLLDDDEQALASHVAHGVEVVLVLPVSGPSPDALPVPLLLRSAQGSARRTGARLVAATLRRRDPDADRQLEAHVQRALGATSLLDALPGDDRWTALLEDHRAGLAPGTAPGTAVGDAEAGVRADLDRWWPPRARRGVVVLLTGLSGSGKSTLARALATHVAEHAGRSVSLLDGDHVRRMLSSGLGFGRADRELNVLRIGYVATEAARHGGVAICAPIAPYASTRAAVRRMVQEVGDLVLVHVSTPLEECERRDVKGLYARARAGEIPAFTGISDPYEEPDDADVVVDTSVLAPAEALDLVVGHLVEGGWIGPGITSRS